MPNFRLLFACVALAGCARGTIGALPAAAIPSAQQRAEPVHAPVVYSSLYSFQPPPDGGQPSGRLINLKGTLYGTTQGGGSGEAGTAFRLTTSGGHEHILYSFRNQLDGGMPAGGLILSNGALYGTTSGGGANRAGTFFKLSSGTETVLYSFAGGTDGGLPFGDLNDVNGDFYGITGEYGDPSCNYPFGCGTVFKMTTAGKEQVLYAFKGGTDGAHPQGLTAVKGTLYGTTFDGGTGTVCQNSGCGTVFALTMGGKERVLYNFTGGADGTNPAGGLINVNGTFYGTTYHGGANNIGTVFKITPAGKETVVYAFKGGVDGALPVARLTDVGGTLYGTTTAGGSKYYGTVFSITTSGSESVLHDFVGGADGQGPASSLIDVKGTLYGTTAAGGGSGNGYGTVYVITP